MSLSTLTAAVLEFRDQRNWAQFHSLRNLIVSLNLEASELLELTQWKNDAEMAAMAGSASAQEALRDECADVLIYLLLIAENAGIDLEQAARAKLVKNAIKYPVASSYGSNRKYSDTRPAQDQTDT
ncbi:MAG: nucleotide pyrophosphohydrolase [Candidatus Accumulibacter phosphatis]|jgi:NTP pyrophosphatase (non-canonical NTP hydrolase)|uniref:Nucleotide pyrophosphohydrolase n=1 Tax=Candidatus Accumulibacter contiguus TaxID=2954381 RepID=A0ABX1TCL3_9PROT|nr:MULTISPECIES: nucleotide pyrophosphohydrolase [Candidatus Accumulibacter]NMQ06527.1 nucleotide pyrophosphohydrolase [Candidatus Accumulibacter contiguus]HRF13385.1 nucleotide pyrophosphohydrolase [Candidatus Accumulibacter phosphatis]